MVLANSLGCRAPLVGCALRTRSQRCQPKWGIDFRPADDSVRYRDWSCPCAGTRCVLTDELDLQGAVPNDVVAGNSAPTSHQCSPVKRPRQHLASGSVELAAIDAGWYPGGTLDEVK